MSLQTMMQAIDEHLATVDFDASRIAFTNVTYAPVAGRPYLRASMVSLTDKALTLGADKATGIGGAGYTLQWDGVYQVDAVWPENAGADGCHQMQQRLLRLFYRGLTLVTTDGLQLHFHEPKPLPIQSDGAWIRGPVRCPWWSLENS